MPQTIMLRRQHDAALVLVGQIVAATEAYSSPNDAYPLTLLLAKLNGLLRIHFAQEDFALYPRMMRSGDGPAARTAQQFHAEMGSLGPIVEEFMRRWSSSALIGSQFADFRRESSNLFAALARRIERENEELYPLAEQMAQDEAA